MVGISTIFIDGIVHPYWIVMVKSFIKPLWCQLSVKDVDQ